MSKQGDDEVMSSVDEMFRRHGEQDRIRDLAERIYERMWRDPDGWGEDTMDRCFDASVQLAQGFARRWDAMQEGES